MASFRIHEDQENTALAIRKENTDLYAAATQRRALGDLSHFACNQNRSTKLPGLKNGNCKIQDENRTVLQIKNEKNIVSQFRAFSVYEDKPGEAEEKKRETTLKPFTAKDCRKETNTFFSNTAENVRVRCSQLEKQIKAPKEDAVSDLHKNKDVPESPMSVADSSVLSLSMSISKDECSVLSDIAEDEETTKAQTAREMFFHVIEYREDIYEYMREIEVKHRANPRYMRKQPDITHLMRSVLVDWLVEVCDEYSQQNETLHLAVSYVDRFLSYMSVVRTKLQLVGTAATYIAAKFEEVYPPEVTEFVYITDDTYTKREVLRMEHLILKVLSFDLSTPTSLAFLSHYCISSGYSKKIFHLAAYIAELSLLEADPYLQYNSSMIAASALATARHCILCEEIECKFDNSACVETAWPHDLAKRTRYQLSDLEPCMQHLARTHSHASVQAYKAIPEKYKNNKFDGVASIEPRPLFDVPPYQTLATRPAPAC